MVDSSGVHINLGWTWCNVRGCLTCRGDHMAGFDHDRTLWSHWNDGVSRHNLFFWIRPFLSLMNPGILTGNMVKGPLDFGEFYLVFRQRQCARTAEQKSWLVWSFGDAFMSCLSMYSYHLRRCFELVSQAAPHRSSPIVDVYSGMLIPMNISPTAPPKYLPSQYISTATFTNDLSQACHVHPRKSIRLITQKCMNKIWHIGVDQYPLVIKALMRIRWKQELWNMYHW